MMGLIFLKESKRAVRKQRAADKAATEESDKRRIQDVSRRADTRYLRDASGVQLCFSWSRPATGGESICSATPSKAHFCE